MSNLSESVSHCVGGGETLREYLDLRRIYSGYPDESKLGGLSRVGVELGGKSLNVTLYDLNPNILGVGSNRHYYALARLMEHVLGRMNACSYDELPAICMVMSSYWYLNRHWRIHDIDITISGLNKEMGRLRSEKAALIALQSEQSQEASRRASLFVEEQLAVKRMKAVNHVHDLVCRQKSYIRNVCTLLTTMGFSFRPDETNVFDAVGDEKGRFKLLECIRDRCIKECAALYQQRTKVVVEYTSQIAALDGMIAKCQAENERQAAIRARVESWLAGNGVSVDGAVCGDATFAMYKDEGGSIADGGPSDAAASLDPSPDATFEKDWYGDPTVKEILLICRQYASAVRGFVKNEASTSSEDGFHADECDATVCVEDYFAHADYDAYENHRAVYGDYAGVDSSPRLDECKKVANERPVGDPCVFVAAAIRHQFVAYGGECKCRMLLADIALAVARGYDWDSGDMAANVAESVAINAYALRAVGHRTIETVHKHPYFEEEHYNYANACSARLCVMHVFCMDGVKGHEELCRMASSVGSKMFRDTAMDVCYAFYTLLCFRIRRMRRDDYLEEYDCMELRKLRLKDKLRTYEKMKDDNSDAGRAWMTMNAGKEVEWQSEYDGCEELLQKLKYMYMVPHVWVKKMRCKVDTTDVIVESGSVLKRKESCAGSSEVTGGDQKRVCGARRVKPPLVERVFDPYMTGMSEKAVSRYREYSACNLPLLEWQKQHEPRLLQFPTCYVLGPRLSAIDHRHVELSDAGMCWVDSFADAQRRATLLGIGIVECRYEKMKAENICKLAGSSGYGVGYMSLKLGSIRYGELDWYLMEQVIHGMGMLYVHNMFRALKDSLSVVQCEMGLLLDQNLEVINECLACWKRALFYIPIRRMAE